MAGVAQLVERWIVIPWPPSNISDLAPKPVRTFADKRVFADKLRTNRKERHGKVEAPSNQGKYFYQPGRWVNV